MYSKGTVQYCIILIIPVANVFVFSLFLVHMEVSAEDQLQKTSLTILKQDGQILANTRAWTYALQLEDRLTDHWASL